MSNAYGFDFLKSEHNLPADATSATTAPPISSTAFPPPPPPHPKYEPTTYGTNRSDLEKQFDVIKFLNAHRSSGCLPPSVIRKSVGVDLTQPEHGPDAAVASMLAANPKVRIESVPDPENPSLTMLTYGYQAKFGNVHDSVGLLAQINRCKNGVAVRDLADAYDGVEDDVTALITAGDVLAVHNPEDRDRVLFPRGEQFLVEMDGCVGIPAKVVELEEMVRKEEESRRKKEAEAGTGTGGGSNGGNGTSNPGGGSGSGTTDDDIVQAAIRRAKAEAAKKRLADATCAVETDVDPRKQIRRGEAVSVGGTWFRLSSAVREGLPLSEQPVRAQAPPSVVSIRDLSKKNDAEGYVRPFDARTLPLDRPLPPSAVRNLKAAGTARAKLHRMAAGGQRGVTGGASAQLLSSNASAANPETLAAAFASSVAASGTHLHHGHGSAVRKRPTGGGSTAAGRAGGGAGGGGGGGGGAVPSSPHNPRRAAQIAEEARQAASDPALAYSHARRHGCTKDVRDMYLETRSAVEGKSEVDIYNLMIEYKLIEPGEPMRRPRMKKKNANLDNDGKPKKKRYYVRKNQKITNVHLEGTEIGQVLAMAAQKQQQGKSVGDGGM